MNIPSGMDVIYHRGDIGEYGFAAKIVPEFSEKEQKTFRGCLHKVGSKTFPIRIQSIVPNMKFFKVCVDLIQIYHLIINYEL